jgi:hypothetical protein
MMLRKEIFKFLTDTPSNLTVQKSIVGFGKSSTLEVGF